MKVEDFTVEIAGVSVPIHAVLRETHTDFEVVIPTYGHYEIPGTPRLSCRDVESGELVDAHGAAYAIVSARWRDFVLGTLLVR